jgi:hypothetical protein
VGKQVSRPICFLRNAAVLLLLLAEGVEFSNLGRTFREFESIGMIWGVGICPLVCPCPFGMAVEAVDKDNATLDVSSFESNRPDKIHRLRKTYSISASSGS